MNDNFNGLCCSCPPFSVLCPICWWTFSLAQLPDWSLIDLFSLQFIEHHTLGWIYLKHSPEHVISWLKTSLPSIPECTVYGSRRGIPRLSSACPHRLPGVLHPLPPLLSIQQETWLPRVCLPHSVPLVMLLLPSTSHPPTLNKLLSSTYSDPTLSSWAKVQWNLFLFYSSS